MDIITKPKLSRRIWDYALLTILAVVVLAPFLIGLWTSFLPTMQIAKGNFLSTQVSFQNYIDAFTQTPILRYLGNSWSSQRQP